MHLYWRIKERKHCRLVSHLGLPPGPRLRNTGSATKNSENREYGSSFFQTAHLSFVSFSNVYLPFYLSLLMYNIYLGHETNSCVEGVNSNF